MPAGSFEDFLSGVRAAQARWEEDPEKTARALDWHLRRYGYKRSEPTGPTWVEYAKALGLPDTFEDGDLRIWREELPDGSEAGYRFVEMGGGDCGIMPRRLYFQVALDATDTTRGLHNAGEDERFSLGRQLFVDAETTEDGDAEIREAAIRRNPNDGPVRQSDLSKRLRLVALTRYALAMSTLPILVFGHYQIGEELPVPRWPRMMRPSEAAEKIHGRPARPGPKSKAAPELIFEIVALRSREEPVPWRAIPEHLEEKFGIKPGVQTCRDWYRKHVDAIQEETI